MKVAILDLHQPSLDSVEDLASFHATSVRLGQALSERGLTVALFQRFGQNLETRFGQLAVFCQSDRYGPLPRLWQQPKALYTKLLAWQPDIAHVQGMSFPLQTRFLCKQPGLNVILQNHADQPLRGWRTRLQAHCYRTVAAFGFAARDLARPWLEAGIIRQPDLVHEVMEDASPFQLQKSQIIPAREPFILWVGHLDANKDPMTVLKAFRDLLSNHPKAQLCMVFRRAPLREQIQAFCRQYPALTDRVELLGEVAHQQMQDLYHRADLFVAASHREGSGYALMEALACGLTPVVSDIPPFRVLTDQGKLGFLFPVADSNCLRAQLERALNLDLSLRRHRVASWYQKRYGMASIAASWQQIYQPILDGCQSNG